MKSLFFKIYKYVQEKGFESFNDNFPQENLLPSLQSLPFMNSEATEENPSLLFLICDVHGHIHLNLPFYKYHRYKEDTHSNNKPDQKCNSPHKEC
jgi:hypothetical protein